MPVKKFKKMELKTKRALVTGADGFIGSHLTEMLAGMGCKVKAMSYYNSFNNWGWLENIPTKTLSKIEVVSGDVRDFNFIYAAMKDVDVVFHLAALIAIPYSYQAAKSYIDTNITGTFNIVQSAKQHSTQRVLITSTSEVYGTARYVPIDEKHPLQAQSPYSASKIGSDAIAMSFYNSFNLPVTVVRPFNTYGPRQSARAVIPTIISQITKGVKKIKLGDVTPTRDFNYVTDTCRGVISLAECDKAIGEVVNIGSNYEISIGDTFKLISELMDSNSELITEKKRLRPGKSEVFRLWCDNTKIENLTGFTPRYSLKEGLKRTIKWFSDPENLSKYKTDIYNV